MNKDTELLFEIGLIKELQRKGYITEEELNQAIQLLEKNYRSDKQ